MLNDHGPLQTSANGVSYVASFDHIHREMRGQKGLRLFHFTYSDFRSCHAPSSHGAFMMQLPCLEATFGYIWKQPISGISVA